MSQAGPELHHEPAYLVVVPGPARVQVPGLALRVRVPGRRVQRLLAVLVLGLGLGLVASAAAGLSARHGGYVADDRPAVAPVPHGPWAAPPAEAAVAARSVPAPVSLIIPAIGVRTRLIRLGLTRSGAMQVPRTTAVAGWYTRSPRPGAVGPAVIGGHVDSHVGPGVFFRLRLLRRGERIYVRQADGRLAVFLVDSVRRYPKDRFPAATVYGPVPTAQLRLITCGGTFDETSGAYLSNIVVYATLTA